MYVGFGNEDTMLRKLCVFILGKKVGEMKQTETISRSLRGKEIF